MPSAVSHAAAASDGYYLYLFGGRNGDGLATNHTQVFDPISESWETSLDGAYPALPEARAGAGKAVYFQGQFFIVGGETASGLDANGTDRVDLFHPITLTWSVGPSLKTGRQGSFPVVAGSRILVAGGRETRETSASTLEVYMP